MTMITEKQCNWLPVRYTDRGTIYRCVNCRTVTPVPLRKPPLRNCLSKHDRQISAIAAPVYTSGEHWLICPHRSPPIATITGHVTGCGCSSSTVEVYNCLHFHEPVLKKAASRCLDQIRERVPGYEGRTCLKCEIPRRSILHVTHKEHWQDQVRRSEYALKANGQWLTASEIVKPTLDQLTLHIGTTRPRLVIVHGFCFPTSDLIRLAKDNPAIQFVSVDHSSLNHTFTWPQYFAEYRQALKASQELPNFHAAAVDRWASWKELGYDRFFAWPNPIYLPPDRDPLPVDPPSLMLTGRVDWMKGLPAQITAASLVQRRRDVQVLISWTNSPERQAGLREHAAACGLKYESLPYGSFDEWYRRLREQVSVVLQPSMSDSFNIATVEAAGHGRPFVGSPTIPHTPAEWLVKDPNNTLEIASVIEGILDNYEAESERAKQIADEVMNRNNAAYSEIIGRLLDGR